MKPSNPYAVALHSKIFHGKVIDKNKRAYKRKPKHKGKSYDQ